MQMRSASSSELIFQSIFRMPSDGFSSRMAMLMASVMQVSAGRFIDVDEVVDLWVAHIDTFIHMVEFLAVKGDAVADVDGCAEPALLGFFQPLHQKAQQAFDTPRLRSIANGILQIERAGEAVHFADVVDGIGAFAAVKFCFLRTFSMG